MYLKSFICNLLKTHRFNNRLGKKTCMLQLKLISQHKQKIADPYVLVI